MASRTAGPAIRHGADAEEENKMLIWYQDGAGPPVWPRLAYMDARGTADDRDIKSELDITSEPEYTEYLNPILHLQKTRPGKFRHPKSVSTFIIKAKM